MTVVGYGTDTFPAFFTASSGVRVPHRVDSASEAAAIMDAIQQVSAVLPSPSLSPLPSPRRVAHS